MWKPEASSETGPTFGTTPAPTPAPRADGPPVHTNRWGTLPIILPFRLFRSFRCSHPPSPAAPCWPSAPRFQSNNGPRTSRSQHPHPDPVRRVVKPRDRGPAKLPRPGIGGRRARRPERVALRRGVPLGQARHLHRIADAAVGARAPQAPDAVHHRFHTGTTTSGAKLV